MRRSAVSVLALLSAMAAAAPLPAQQDSTGPTTWQAPRTELGHPDLQGLWATEFLTFLERPEGVDELVVPAERAGQLAAKLRGAMPHNVDPDFAIHDVQNLLQVKGQYRSSVIVDPADGHLPYSEAGAALAVRLRAQVNEQYDDPEVRPLPERCLSNFGYAPMRAIPLFLPRRIVQTEHNVVIWSEDAAGLRLIHLAGDPPPDAIRTIEGHSRGHWEGDTLVVRTTHLRAAFPARFSIGRPIVLSPETEIEERFTLVSERELNYRYTVHDDALYTQPWSGELSMRRFDGPIFEYACHEGNYSMPNVLRGGQAEADRLAAAGENGLPGDQNP